MEKRRKFDLAETDCKLQIAGGQLVSISSDAENTFVHNLTTQRNCQNNKSGEWIGLNDRDNETTFVWTDGTDSLYRNWHINAIRDGNPPANDNKNCVRIGFNGYWRDKRCYNRRCYICETTARSTTPEAVCQAAAGSSTTTRAPMAGPKSQNCSLNWRANGDRCYRLMLDRKTWLSAEDECVSQDGHLVSITSDSENSVVHSLRRSLSSDEWEDIWIGLNDSTSEGNFGWIDDTVTVMSPLNYTNWTSDEPNNRKFSSGDCVRMVSSGEWRDTPCWWYRPYVCELSIHSISSSPQTSSEGRLQVNASYKPCLVDRPTVHDSSAALVEVTSTAALAVSTPSIQVTPTSDFMAHTSFRPSQMAATQVTPTPSVQVFSVSQTSKNSGKAK
jgi:hypothetical protein